MTDRIAVSGSVRTRVGSAECKTNQPRSCKVHGIGMLGRQPKDAGLVKRPNSSSWPSPPPALRPRPGTLLVLDHQSPATNHHSQCSPPPSSTLKTRKPTPPAPRLQTGRFAQPVNSAVDGAEAIDYLAGNDSFADRRQHLLPALVPFDKDNK